MTGAGGGIGRATALALARRGANVVAVDIDELTAKTTAAACADHDVEATAYHADVADASRFGSSRPRSTPPTGRSTSW